MEIKRMNCSDECGSVKRVQGWRGRKHMNKGYNKLYPDKGEKLNFSTGLKTYRN